MPLTLTYLGHAGFLFDDHQPQGRVLIDPFLTGNPAAKHTPDQLAADTVCFTHGHAGHYNADGLAIAQRCHATLVANHEICADLQRTDATLTTLAGNPGGRVPTPFGSVSFTPATHSSSGTDGRYLGVACGMVLRFDRVALTIYHAGDTALFGDMQLIGELAQPDVALLPAGDRATMGPRLAAKAAELLRPKLAIPMHFNTYPHHRIDPAHFKPAGIPTRILAPGESMTL